VRTGEAGVREHRESRLDAARNRALGAKQLLAGASAVTFVAALALARASHPGQAATPPVDTSSSTAASQQQSDDELQFGYDQGSLAPSTGFAPSAQSSVS